jgi:hypothetical protein
MYHFEWRALDFTVEKQGWFHNSSVADRSRQGPYSTGGLIPSNQCTSGYDLSSRYCVVVVLSFTPLRAEKASKQRKQ